MDSKYGLIIQLAGVCSITLLTLFLRRSINVPALRHWTNAWLFMCFALFCMRLAFSFDEHSTQLLSLFFLNEYAFGFLLIAGCKSLGDPRPSTIRNELFFLPFILVAFGLPFLSDDNNLILKSHSLAMAGFYAVAFISMFSAPVRTFGWKVMVTSLALLTLDLVQYFVIYALRDRMIIDFDHLQYSYVVDLVLQTLLGFGMVIVLLEQVLDDARATNVKLQKAHERLEELAHIDPLTAALNRHAFHGYIKRSGDDNATGCIGFFDVDNLKVVNDCYGHAAGDIVIRSVVKAIRSQIRPEDLIFRWGGDEFFVMMIGLNSATAQERMRSLDSHLSSIKIDKKLKPIAVEVSFAFADFESFTEIERAISSADAGMYRKKQIRKSMVGGLRAVPDPVSEQTEVSAVG